MAKRCFLCLKEEEFVDHIPLHCARTRVLWHLLFSLLGVSWVLPSSVREALLGWHGSFMRKKRKKAPATPLCLFWTVWKERNSRTFDNEGRSIQGLKSSFACNLWAWCKLHLVPSPLSFVDFVECLGSG